MDEQPKPDLLTNISKGTRINADVICDSNIRVSGRINGDLTTKQKLVVTETGHITGTVIAQNAELSGRLTGEVRVLDQLIFKKSAIIDGFIFAKKLILEENAQLNGFLHIGEEVDVINSKVSGTPRKKVENKTSKIPAPEKSTIRHLADVLIGIPQDDPADPLIKQIREAGEKMMEELGYSLEIFDEPSFTPFSQKLTYIRKSTESKHEIKQRFEKAKESLETALLKKEPSKDENGLLNAAIALFQSLKKTDEYALRLGDIILVQTYEDEVQTIVVEILPDTLAAALKKEPQLISNPSFIYKEIES